VDVCAAAGISNSAKTARLITARICPPSSLF
jgi:hypothetical protein